MLCSRANTREEAAMSGSIAAFVFRWVLFAASSFSIRPHPLSHTGCPRGVPGPLAVLTRLRQR